MAKRKQLVIKLTKGTNVGCPMWRDGDNYCGVKCPEFYDRRKHVRIPRTCPAKNGIIIIRETK